MESLSLHLTHNNRQMQFSGVHKCIFSGHLLMWFVYNGSFYFLNLNKQSSIIIMGTQVSGKSRLARYLEERIKQFNKLVKVSDEITSETHLDLLVTKATENDDMCKQIIGMRKIDVKIYCCQNSFTLPLKYKTNSNIAIFYL